jgi:hypothetical protein
VRATYFYEACPSAIRADTTGAKAPAQRDLFSLERQLRNVDKIFDRVFGGHPAGERGIANMA